MLVTFRLLDRQVDESSFFQNSDGTRDHDRKLDFTNTRGILNPFWVIVDGARKYFRYVEGCAIFDPAEQEKQKIVANFQNSTIQFNKGADIILDDQKMKPLIDFLKIHPLNPGSPYHKEDHDSLFYEFDHKKIVDKEIEEANIQDTAFELFGSFSKNAEKMKSLALLFETTKNLQTDEEIYLGLRSIAKTRPADFIGSIGNKDNEVLSQVLKAQSSVYGIIGKDIKGYFYEADKSSLFEIVEKNKKVAEEALVAYLITKEGDVHYRNLLLKIRQKEVELEAPAGELEKPKVIPTLFEKSEAEKEKEQLQLEKEQFEKEKKEFLAMKEKTEKDASLSSLNEDLKTGKGAEKEGKETNGKVSVQK